MAFLKRKRFKFNVNLQLLHLSDVPLVNAILFAKVRLLHGGNFEGTTDRVEVSNHAAIWNQCFTFLCRIACDPDTGVLEKCECRISLRKEQRGGKSYQKLGFVDVNLSQFAASGVEGIAESYLLDGYGMNQRQDNSRLSIKVTMSHLNADPIFKVPRIESHIEELNPLDRKAPSGSDELSNNRKASGPDTDSNNSSSAEDINHVIEDICAPPVISIATFPVECQIIKETPLMHSVTSVHTTCSAQPVEVSRSQNNVSTHVPTKRLNQDRSQLGNGGDCAGGTTRVRATRVDAKDLIERMVAETVGSFEGPDVGENSEGLALFVSKDGEAVVAGNSNHSTDAFERVHIADTSATLSTG